MGYDNAQQQDLYECLVVTEKLSNWQRLKALVLDSVSPPFTRRV
jgi:hypothetical protein